MTTIRIVAIYFTSLLVGCGGSMEHPDRSADRSAPADGADPDGRADLGIDALDLSRPDVAVDRLPDAGVDRSTGDDLGTDAGVDGSTDLPSNQVTLNTFENGI